MDKKDAEKEFNLAKKIGSIALLWTLFMFFVFPTMLGPGDFGDMESDDEFASMFFYSFLMVALSCIVAAYILARATILTRSFKPPLMPKVVILYSLASACPIYGFVYSMATGISASADMRIYVFPVIGVAIYLYVNSLKEKILSAAVNRT
jgi:F0F1-type ATP synthase membrane subunit c/vacuolar-type H+-ATPase subunit K